MKKLVTMCVTDRLVPVTVAMVFCATAVFAQTSDPRESARTHLGPVYITPSLALDELGLDTNVFNNPTELSDFTFTVLPGAQLAVPFGTRGVVTATTLAELIYYNRYSSERSVNPDIKVRGEFSLNRVTLFLSPSYVNSRRQPSLEIDERVRHTSTDITGGGTARISQRLSIEASGGVARVSYDEGSIFDSTSLRETLNRRTQSASLALHHDVTPLTRASLRATYSTDDFDYTPTRNATSFALLPGVEFKPLALISGSAAIGIRRFRPENPLIQDFTGVIARANLAYTLQGFTRFRFSADRNLAFSYSQAAPYYVTNGYGIGIDRHVGGRFDVTGDLSWLMNSYKTIVGIEPMPEKPPVDRLTTWSLGVGYRLARARRVGFDVTYRERTSNTEIFVPYSGLRVMWSVESGLQRP
jgi:hypothetical protein